MRIDALFLWLMRDPETRPPARHEDAEAPAPANGVEIHMLVGIVGVVALNTATRLNGLATPLSIVNHWGGSVADVGLGKPPGSPRQFGAFASMEGLVLSHPSASPTATCAQFPDVSMTSTGVPKGRWRSGGTAPAAAPQMALRPLSAAIDAETCRFPRLRRGIDHRIGGQGGARHPRAFRQRGGSNGQRCEPDFDGICCRRDRRCRFCVLDDRP